MVANSEVGEGNLADAREHAACSVQARPGVRRLPRGGDVSRGRSRRWRAGYMDSLSCFLEAGSRSCRPSITWALVGLCRLGAASARENGIVGRGETHWRRGRVDEAGSGRGWMGLQRLVGAAGVSECDRGECVVKRF